MKPIPWSSVLAAVAGLVAGIGLSRSPVAAAEAPRVTVAGESEGTKVSHLRTPEERSGRFERSGAPADGHRLQDLFSLDWRLLYLDETERQLLKADIATLRSWLDELQEREKQGPSLHLLNLRNRVIRQLYDREGSGLLARAEAEGNATVMAEGLKCLARQDAKAAVAWVDRFKTVQERAADPGSSDAAYELKALLRDLHDAAVFQGPEVIGAVHQKLGGERGAVPGPGSLPDDFDHATFLHALDPSQVISYGGGQSVVASWAMRDRHAALQFARELDASEFPGAIRLVPETFLAVGRLEGEESAARWLSEELADASAAERERILVELFPYQSPSPATFAAVLRGLAREEDAAIFRESLKRRFPEGGR